MTAAIRCITLISTQNKKLPCHDRTFFSKLGWKTPGVTHYDSDKERALLKWQLHCLLASLLAWHATAWPKKYAADSDVRFQSFVFNHLNLTQCAGIFLCTTNWDILAWTPLNSLMSRTAMMSPGLTGWIGSQQHINPASDRPRLQVVWNDVKFRHVSTVQNKIW